ncbi:MAG: hypothetical protein Q8Q32_03130 [bacterium]|nr:hypothetical protein [bacterium]
MFGETPNQINAANLAFFVPEELFWGLGLIIASILFSFIIWRMKAGFSIKGIVLWLINLGLFVYALMRVSAAFPRIPGYVTFGVLLILILVLTTGGVVASKKEGAGSKGSGKSGESEPSK